MLNDDYLKNIATGEVPLSRNQCSRSDLNRRKTVAHYVRAATFRVQFRILHSPLTKLFAENARDRI
ncbi:hypothetical protein EA473_07490 [Natrarchaeobius chitinivorans]|uniref:Uncharacterized protein n=1 Tax=Natrarchaeobius chitinivorans TaxID=1679083 RepID=A0A3N6PAA1_NATCH|nr:hypothetical protein EA473_07490 [Natrarchaeobius chitinivorans]